MKRHLTAALLPALVLVLSLAGCSEDSYVTGPGPQTAPELPPASTMSMDVSLFDSAPVDPQVVAEGGYGVVPLEAGLHTKLNFINAALRVHFINIVLCAALVEPVAAFALAAQSVPQPQRDGSWLWTYIFVGDEAEYSIFLYGKNMGTYTEWRMEVSSTDPEAPFDHFVWFEGQVEMDESSGYWQFYEPEEDPPVLAMAAVGVVSSTPGVPVIRIDWENRENDEHELVFLINKEGIPEEGSTLTYFESPTMSSVDFYNAANGNTGIIIWYPDGSGSIEWPDYRDGGKYCWNAFQRDTDCEE
jgi:hypothetical protein